MKNILLVSLFLLSANVHSEVVPLDVIAEWGYQEKHSGYLSKYCLGEFQPSNSEYHGIRSLNNSAVLPEAKYRFTLAKEVYEVESDAIKRELAILQPLNRNSKQSKLCDIRKAIRVRNTVYFIHTDVGVFRNELHFVFDKLEGYLSR